MKCSYIDDCMNSKEKNIKEDIKEMNKKENPKNFWKKLNEKWLLVNIISYIVGTIIFWWLFFIGIIDLLRAIFLTILNPLILVLIYYFFNYVRVSKHQKLITKIVLVGCGGFGFGGILWFFTGYVLISAPWAPLQDLPPVLRGRLFLLLLVPSCGFAAYIMYRIGKKREWRPPSHLIS